MTERAEGVDFGKRLQDILADDFQFSAATSQPIDDAPAADEAVSGAGQTVESYPPLLADYTYCVAPDLRDDDDVAGDLDKVSAPDMPKPRPEPRFSLDDLRIGRRGDDWSDTVVIDNTTEGRFDDMVVEDVTRAVPKCDFGWTERTTGDGAPSDHRQSGVTPEVRAKRPSRLKRRIGMAATGVALYGILYGAVNVGTYAAVREGSAQENIQNRKTDDELLRTFESWSQFQQSAVLARASMGAIWKGVRSGAK